jgi:hypothetical protein
MLSPRIELREFAGQYLMGNVISTAASVLVGVLVSHLTGSAAITAIAATVAATLVWYAYLLIYYIMVKGDLTGAALQHLVADFGAAEALDSLFVRPLLTYLMPRFTHNQASGILFANILADVIYTAIGLNRQRHRTLN